MIFYLFLIVRIFESDNLNKRKIVQFINFINRNDSRAFFVVSFFDWGGMVEAERK